MSVSDVRLFPHTPQYLRAILSSVEDYENLTGLTVADGVREFIVGPEVSPEFLEQLRNRKETDPWQDGFGVLLGRKLIGLCSFAGPPTDECIAEIAYGIAPKYQGHGYATAAARALVVYAERTGKVRRLWAHTLPQENASTRVLRKCGFTFAGEVMDAEDSKVWRWERPTNLVSADSFEDPS